MRELMIVASDLSPTATERSVVVTTPLDAIVQLEQRNPIHTVVLTGTYARDSGLAAFLREFYPSVHVDCEA